MHTAKFDAAEGSCALKMDKDSFYELLESCAQRRPDRETDWLAAICPLYQNYILARFGEIRDHLFGLVSFFRALTAR